MTSDKHQQAKTDLLRELETLQAELDNPASAQLGEDEIPILMDRVEKAVSASPDLDRLAEDGLEPAEIDALREAYQQAAEDLQKSEARLLEAAVQNLKEDRQAIEAVTGDAWQTATAPGVLPGQQSLFEPSVETDDASLNKAAQSAPEPAPAPRPKALGENPFLPPHIRERLQERRQALEKDIAQAASFFPKHGAQQTLGPADNVPSHQALIDELVAEYLPRIEADLRSRLKRRLSQVEPQQEPQEPDAGNE